MPTTDATPRTPFDLTAPFEPWVDAAQTYNRWLIGLLDVQTLWWKDVERRAAGLMQGWLGPVLPPASAQGLAGPNLALAWQRAWADGWQVWVNALQHDATEA
ncbi:MULTISPECIES: hypothetical protein [Roseateles]|uniref:Poly(3-hydroxyalkanoate) polymerase subunit PhaE n=1 Tax=Pelomonas caseinilytica TaxID=2906763 RepID=A0ABS8XRC0_9BURK|nr:MULTISPECIES: hypothetical protein [unclassified Roseateles]MCE4539760.1 hypothetical protein [Pelomonas sp. P7]HEV6963821.1 hypothetical protein [Roseateles sp.]